MGFIVRGNYERDKPRFQLSNWDAETISRVVNLLRNQFPSILDPAIIVFVEILIILLIIFLNKIIK